MNPFFSYPLKQEWYGWVPNLNGSDTSLSSVLMNYDTAVYGPGTADVSDLSDSSNGHGAIIDITQIDGLDLPQPRSNVNPKGGMHGSWVDASFVQERNVVFTGTVYVLDPRDVDLWLNWLKKCFGPNSLDGTLYVGRRWDVITTTDVAQADVVLNGKVTNFQYSKTQTRSYGQIDFQLTITCGDPMMYGNENSHTIGMFIASGATGNVDSVSTVPIGGNANSPFKLVIPGPITGGSWNLIIMNASTSYHQWTLYPYAGASLALTATQTLTIDTAKQAVYFTDNSSGAITSWRSYISNNVLSTIPPIIDWSGLPPGASYKVRIVLSAANAAANGGITMTAQNAWW